MSKAITISIPDQLHERLGKFGADLNRSRICQRALEEAIERRERREQRTEDDMEDLATRLAEQLEKDEGESFDAGHEAGVEYAKTYAELRDLRLLDSQREHFNERWLDGIRQALEWPDDFEGYVQEAGLDDAQYDQEAFWRGFATGAVETYQKAMKLIEEKKLQ